MQRFKKPLVWLSLLVLIVGLIPVGVTPAALAAGTTTYFTPDDRDVLKTANYGLGDAGIKNDDLLRQHVKVTNSPTISISGTYSKVSGDSLSAQIDLLSWDSANSTWVVDGVHSVPGTVLADNSNANRFNASNLTLFPGLNRITFGGQFGNVQGSETFYVLYDKIPYFSKLAIAGSGFLNDINLNEGTRAVVKNPQIYLTGEVYNTTKATVSVNGGSALSTDIYNNQLTTPPLKLNSGLNKLSITFTNGSDSIQITRDVYYFTDKDPFIDIHVLDNNNGAKAYDLLNSTPSLKKGTSIPNDLIVQMLLPYAASTADFATDHSIKIDGTEITAAQFKLLAPNLYDDDQQFKVPTDPAEEVIIEDATGPAYRLVTFEISGVPFQNDGATPPVIKAVQNPKIDVNFGAKSTDPVTGAVTAWNYTASRTPSYKLSDKTTIKSIKYLSDYATTDNGDISNVSQLPLDGANVGKNAFYIMVETDSAVLNANLLAGKYLPLGTKTLTISSGVQAKNGATPLANTYIYQVTGFAVGEQNVEFAYPDSLPIDVTISYSSISGILVDNLVDGQSYTYNSSTATNGKADLVISGEYYGFDTHDASAIADINPEYFVNGINIQKETPATDYGTDTILVDPTNLANPLGNDFPRFSLSLYISAAGPFVAGENTIEFRGQYRDAAGNLVPVSKKLRIYIIDENVASVTQFHPGKVPQTALTGDDRAPFPTAAEFALSSTDAGRPAVDQKISQVLQMPTEFTYKDDKYTTSEQNYDLVIRGSGATTLNLMSGTQQIFTIQFPADHDPFTTTTGVYPTTGTPKYVYEIVGSDKDFLLRLSNYETVAPDGSTQVSGDLNFNGDSTGSHVYNLELINSTGARTTQRLEIDRELPPYRLLSPVPTVGDQYVVNKNFVRFDVEAEGATSVVIGKDQAVRSTDPNKPDRFTMDYVGLKPDKLNPIKIQIVRASGAINDTINVYYTSQVGIDTQYMAEKPTTKYTVFNKDLTLSFPKGTIMESADQSANQVTKFYPDTKLLFGIADPKDGVVERRNDYGVYIDKNTEINNNNNLLDSYKSNFTATDQTFNFTRISDIYWISGGVGELGNKGEPGYKPATNGLPPYSTEGIFTAFEPERTVVPSQRGTLTIGFDSNVVDDAGTTVTVFKYTDVGGIGKWARVPAEVDTKAHTATVPFDEFGYYAVYKLNRSFPDITNHPWARNILNALYSKGIMDYLRSDAFGADDQTTRGEFATLLVKGLNLPINVNDGDQTFFDVPFGSKTVTWDYEHLETAAKAGIITGMSEGFFQPNMPITRQDAAVMIARALQLKLPLNDSKLSANLAKSFLDSGSINYYAQPAVQAVSSAKIMTGSPITLPGAKKPSYNFSPNSNMTRAEAGKVAVELLKKSTSLFPKNFS